MKSIIYVEVMLLTGFPGGSDGKSVCLQCGRLGFDPWVRKIPWRRKWQSTPALLPGKSHGQRRLVDYSPWGRKESDTTERLHFHFSLSCIGEGNGNPLQYSCLENPMDRGAWWATVHGVAKSQTWLSERLKDFLRQRWKWSFRYLLLVEQFSDI